MGRWCEKLWPYEFLESFRGSILSVPICFVPEPFLLVKSYDNLNFPRASVVQFRTSRYIERLIRTSEWKVMTIWISWELQLFNFERLDISCLPFWHPCEKLWPFEYLESCPCSISCLSICYGPESDILVKRYDHLNFSRALVDLFSASGYIMRLTGTSVRKVMTFWNSREPPLFNFEHLDMLCAWIGHPSEMLWSFEFLERFRWSI